jgi:hypothetical protein
MELFHKEAPARPAHWTLLRDIGVLQVKLIIDGFRDLLLVPASLIAGVISFMKLQDGKPGREFYELVSVGRQSERWINLFGAIKNAPAEIREQNHFGETDIDEIVSRVESFVVDEYQRGGVTAQAKARMDKVLDKIQQRARQHKH